MQDYLNLLPEDLKRELGKWLHRLYFAVVLDELKLMTGPVTESLDKVQFSNQPLSYPYYISPCYSYVDQCNILRWQVYQQVNNERRIDNTNEMKKRVSGKMARLP
jgi:hypothetical protein